MNWVVTYTPNNVGSEWPELTNEYLVDMHGKMWRKHNAEFDFDMPLLPTTYDEFLKTPLAESIRENWHLIKEGKKNGTEKSNKKAGKTKAKTRKSVKKSAKNSKAGSARKTVRGVGGRQSASRKKSRRAGTIL
jgi:hypothetical protein